MQTANFLAEMCLTKKFFQLSSPCYYQHFFAKPSQTNQTVNLIPPKKLLDLQIIDNQNMLVPKKSLESSRVLQNQQLFKSGKFLGASFCDKAHTSFDDSKATKKSALKILIQKIFEKSVKILYIVDIYAASRIKNMSISEYRG